MSSKYFRMLDRKRRRHIKKLKKPLVPTEWFTYVSEKHETGIYVNYRMNDDITQEFRQAYFNTLYGNIYTGNPQNMYRVRGGNHMFLSALVGSGNYTSFQFLDLQTNQKWEYSFDHSTMANSQPTWLLVSEFEVNP